MTEHAICATCGWRHDPAAECKKVKWRAPGVVVDAPTRGGNPTLEPVTIPLVCPECGTMYEGVSHKPLEEGEVARPRRCEHCRGGDQPAPKEHPPLRPKPKVLELRRPARPRNFYEREEE